MSTDVTLADTSTPRHAPFALTRAALLCTALSCAALCSTACNGGLTSMPHIGVYHVGTLDVPTQQARFARLVEAARAHGYDVSPLQPSRSRFGVLTHYTDRYASALSEYRIAVECLPVGGCRITPLGPRVEMVYGTWHLPEGLRGELEEFERIMRIAAVEAPEG